MYPLDFGGQPDPDQSGNLDHNPVPFGIEATKIKWVKCTWCWQRYTLSECSVVIAETENGRLKRTAILERTN